MIGDGSRALVERALAATGPASHLAAALRSFLPIYEAQSIRLSHLYPGVADSLAHLTAAGARRVRRSHSASSTDPAEIHRPTPVLARAAISFPLTARIGFSTGAR